MENLNQAQNISATSITASSRGHSSKIIDLGFLAFLARHDLFDLEEVEASTSKEVYTSKTGEAEVITVGTDWTTNVFSASQFINAYCPISADSSIMEQNSQISNYIACILCFIPKHKYEGILIDLCKVLKENNIYFDIRILLKAEVKLIIEQGVRPNIEAICICAFVALTAIKKYGEPNSYKNWLKQRLKALTCKMIVLPNYISHMSEGRTQDAVLLGSFFESHKAVLRILLRPFLYNDFGITDEDEIPYYNTLKVQIQMIFTNYGMSSLMLAKSFAKYPHSEVFFYEEIKQQAKYVLSQYDRILEDHKTKGYPYDFEFRYVFLDHDDLLSIKEYPDLIYCAKKSKADHHASFKNFKIGTHKTKLPKNLLDQKMLCPIDPFSDGTISEICADYIREHGREVPKHLQPRCSAASQSSNV